MRVCSVSNGNCLKRKQSFAELRVCHTCPSSPGPLAAFTRRSQAPKEGRLVPGFLWASCCFTMTLSCMTSSHTQAVSISVCYSETWEYVALHVWKISSWTFVFPTMSLKGKRLSLDVSVWVLLCSCFPSGVLMIFLSTRCKVSWCLQLVAEQHHPPGIPAASQRLHVHGSYRLTPAEGASQYVNQSRLTSAFTKRNCSNWQQVVLLLALLSSMLSFLK